jgi:hypothetical protein
MSSWLAYPDLALHSSCGKFLDLELIFFLIMWVFLQLKLGPPARKKKYTLLKLTMYIFFF